MILIVMGQNHDFLNATSQGSVYRMDVVEVLMLVCAVSHVRKNAAVDLVCVHSQTKLF